MTHLRVGVVFGGRSVEHEVSVLSGHQVMAAMDPALYEAVPVYIAKSGAWYTGEPVGRLDEYRDPEALVARAQRVQLSTDPRRPGLVSLSAGRRLFAGGDAEVQPLDVVFPVMHGSHGEDGTLQGLCEMGDIAYCGPDVASSAVCMDKAFAKVLWRAAGLPVLDDVTVSRSRWQSGSDRVAEDVRTRFGYPVFVKPLSLGSSIGVSRVESDQVLERAMEVAYAYQDRVIVEPAQDDIIEINCSVLGDPDSARASVCEQPVTAGVLSYEDKYMSGGKGDRKGGPKGAGASGAKGDGVPKGGMRSARRIIPAPIDDGLRDTIQQAAVRACASLGVSGVARVDFLVRPEHNAFLVNEINPIPGSLSFYLWEPMGVTFTQLCSEVIDLALRRHAVKRASTYSIDSWLLKR